MTPTGQDKELREQIHKLFGDGQAYDGGYHSCYDGKWIDMTNEVCAVADFITADRKRVALEARINENNMYIRELTRHYFPSGPGEPHIPLVQFHERIAELKAQQEGK